MTEEKIIDGVDVAGCEHRSDTHKELLADGAIKEFSNYCYISNDGCYGINCYYKQLKRLEKEVKHWQTEHREAKAKGEWTYDLVRKKADRLKQENERLKKSIERYRSANERLYDKRVDDFNLTLTKYKSVLEEIREDMEKDTTCESRECGCDDYAECLNCIKETILNKINEVLK